MLIQVHAPHFVAGLVVEDGRCTEAAPILRRLCMGKGEVYLRHLFKQRGWRAIIVQEIGQDG